MRSRDRLGTRTDILVKPRVTTCLARDGYQLVRTESNPSFIMGNYLILDEPPALDRVDAWMARCWDELGDLPIKKRFLGWESDAGQLWPGPDQDPPEGYERFVVLAISQPPEPSRPLFDQAGAGIEFRQVGTDHEWQQVPALSALCLETPIEGYADWVRWHYEQARDSLGTGPGKQWGAWRGDQLVASLGLFSTPAALRFQEVQTHPEHRRKGICTALCVHALRHHMAAEPGKQAVIVAEAGSQAERIYRRIGFGEIGWQHTLERQPPG